MKKRKTAGGLRVIVFVTAVAVLLSGCLKKEDPNLEVYQSYVSSLLDMNYHADWSAYVSLTHSEETDAAAIYELSVSAGLESLMEYYSIPKDKVSEESINQIREITKEIYKSTKYTVDKAVFDKGVYQVTIHIQPMDFFVDAQDEFSTYMDEFNTRAENGEFAEMSEEEYEQEYTDGIISMLQEKVNDIGYEPEVIYTVTILSDEEGKSYVSEQELANISNLMIAQ